MKTHKNSYSSPEAVAEAFAAHLQQWVSKKEKFTVALSGGSTPKLLFQHLAEHYLDRLDWARLHIFWGDERCVPPDHEESNYKMTDENLLRFVPIPSENIHRIWGEAEPILESERYSAEILSGVPVKHGWPHFDLVMLGLGEDGHTASIFPNQMELLNLTKVCAVAAHPVSGQHRISLTGKVISNAEKVAFLVTGSGKQKVTREIFEKTGDWESYPASHITAQNDLYWFLDEAAAHSSFIVHPS